MMHEIYKPIEVANGEILESGTIVETSGWRNEQALIDQGKIGSIRKSQKILNKFVKNEGIQLSDVATTVKKKSTRLRIPAKPPKG